MRPNIEHDPVEDPEYPLTIVVAMGENRVIGAGGRMPWHLPGDLREVKRLTMGGTLIMGRKTWDAIGRPLPGRVSMIVSRSLGQEIEDPERGVYVARNLEEAIDRGGRIGGELFCFGGASLYAQSIPRSRLMYLTLVHGRFEGDAFFPDFDHRDWRLVREEPRTGFTRFLYERKGAIAAVM